MPTYDSPSKPARPATRWVPLAVLAAAAAFCLVTGSLFAGAIWLLLTVAVAAITFRPRGAKVMAYAALTGAVAVLAFAVASGV